jgi:hypothetical protein
MAVLMVLLILVAAFVGFSGSPTDSLSHSYQLPVASRSHATKEVIDSVKTVRDQFVAQKEDLKTKIQILQEQQRKIKDSQKQIDSLTGNIVVQQVMSATN